MGDSSRRSSLQNRYLGILGAIAAIPCECCCMLAQKSRADPGIVYIAGDTYGVDLALSVPPFERCALAYMAYLGVGGRIE